jgi:hypothetical protein
MSLVDRNVKGCVSAGIRVGDDDAAEAKKSVPAKSVALFAERAQFREAS